MLSVFALCPFALHHVYPFFPPLYRYMTLEEVRAEITRLDEDIVRLIAKRQSYAKKVAELKQAAGIPVHNSQRKNDVLAYVMTEAKAERLDPAPVKEIFEILISMNEKAQRAALGEKVPPKRIVR